MNTSIYSIPISNLLLILLPVCIVLFFYMRWAMDFRTVVYALGRMVSQLLLVGYVLIFIFNQKDSIVSILILCCMLLASSWIALRPLKQLRRQYYFKALLSIAIGGVPVLALVILGVIRLDPWYLPKYLIPLAGMIFANSMNSVSLCAERFHSEMIEGKSFVQARKIAYGTALLPLINSFFAVGLVSLPGMMTGQILAGISPLIAVRYQIMVMCMLLGASGISSASYLVFMSKLYVYKKE